MSEFYASGRVIDLVLVLMTAEAAAMLYYNRLTGRGLAPLDVLSSVLAGIFLALALRAALVRADWPWIGAALTGALAAHLWDLYRRWTRPSVR